MKDKIIRTSDPQWLEKTLKLYSKKDEFTIIDDADLGLSKDDVSSVIKIVRAAREKGKIDAKRILSALSGAGLTTTGVWMVYAAIIDPEPTSKLSLLVGGGILCILTGSLTLFSSLGVNITVRVGKGGVFEIFPKKEE